MALDFEALKKKLGELQGQNKRNSSVWKPTKGDTTIRMVPWVGNRSNPFTQLYFHYLGSKTYLSPLSFGRPDPIAEFADKLMATGDREDWIQGKKQFSPKLRTYVPIIVRGEEDEGVRFWSFGKTIYEELMKIMIDPDWGDITDVQTGRDIKVTFTPQKDSDTDYSKTAISIKPNPTPLTKDSTQLKQWLENQPDVNKLFEEPSYDELKTVLENYLKPSTEPSVTQSEKSPSPVVENEKGYPAAWDGPTKPVPSAKEAPKVSSAKEVSDEFDKIFADK